MAGLPEDESLQDVDLMPARLHVPEELIAGHAGAATDLAARALIAAALLAKLSDRERHPGASDDGAEQGGLRCWRDATFPGGRVRKGITQAHVVKGLNARRDDDRA